MTDEIQSIAVDLIDPSPLNPRQDIDGELAESLTALGQLEPVLLRPHPSKKSRYELANGHRRWAGAKKAKLPFLLARVRELTDAQMLDVMLGSGGEGNVKPLTPMDEAAGYHSAMQVLKLSIRGVAEHYGKGRDYVHQRIALLELPDAAKKAVVAGTLPAKTAWLVARIPDAARRIEVAKVVLHSTAHDGPMPFAAAKCYIEHHVCRALAGAPFDIKDAELVKEVGACSTCPFNSSTNRETYGDAPNHRCMSPTCFEKKVAASRSRLIAREEKAGKKVLDADANSNAFPLNDTGLSWRSGYVEFSKPPPADLLKKEVSSVPSWRDLVGDAAQVYVGFDQSGRAVDLLKVEEAILAADENDRAIFAPEVIKRYNLDKGADRLKEERTRALPETPKKRATKAETKPSTPSEEQHLPEEEKTGWSGRASEWIARALEAAPEMPSALRNVGFDLLREVGAPTQTQHAFDEQDPDGSAEDVEALKSESVVAFEAAGLRTQAARDRLTKFAVGGKNFSELSIASEFRALLKVLSKRAQEEPS